MPSVFLPFFAVLHSKTSGSFMGDNFQGLIDVGTISQICYILILISV